MNIQHFYRRSEGVKGDALHCMDCGLDNVYLKNGFQLERAGRRRSQVTDMMAYIERLAAMQLSRKAPSA